MDAGVPLVVPEINPGAIREHRGIIANSQLRRHHLDYTAVAHSPCQPDPPADHLNLPGGFGCGSRGDGELRESTRAYLDGREYRNTVLPHPYAFNLFSHNTKVDPVTGYNDEETKVIQETRKIFGDSEIRVSATCVRVPVLRAHCVSLTFECERRLTPRSCVRLWPLRLA